MNLATKINVLKISCYSKWYAKTGVALTALLLIEQS